MALAVRIERTIRSLRDRLLDGLLSMRTVRKAAYRHLSANDNLVFRRFADHDLVLDPGDLVGKTVLETGSFDRRRTTMICQRAAGLSDRRTVLEIGANIGPRPSISFAPACSIPSSAWSLIRETWSSCG